MKQVAIVVGIGVLVSTVLMDVMDPIRGFFEELVVQLGMALSVCLFVYNRKAIKRIQELEKELEQKS